MIGTFIVTSMFKRIMLTITFFTKTNIFATIITKLYALDTGIFFYNSKSNFWTFIHTFSIFIKKFIFAYIMTMPFGFVSDFAYWTIGITVFTFYALASLELIAEEIEDPFGTDSNDLPTDDLAETIGKNVAEVVG